MIHKHEQAFLEELKTLDYPKDIQRITHIRQSISTIRYKEMKKRWFRPEKKAVLNQQSKGHEHEKNTCK